MQPYPRTTSVVQPSEPLNLLIRVLTRPATDSVAKVAADHQCSAAHVYELLGRARAALAPARPGPLPGARTAAHLHERVADLEDQLIQAQLRLRVLEQRLAGAVALDPRRLARLELVMAGYNVPFRGMHEILTVAFGAKAARSVGHDSNATNPVVEGGVCSKRCSGTLNGSPPAFRSGTERSPGR